MLAVVLALGAALGWGVSDFLGGLTSRSRPLLTVLLISQLCSLVLLTVLVAVHGSGPPASRFLLAAAAAGLGETLGVAALYRGLAVGTMSVVAPVASIAPALPLLVGLVGGEVPAPMQGVGLVLALVGIVLTAVNRRAEARAASGAGRSVLYGLLSALGFGCFFVALDGASNGPIPWALLMARLTAVAAIAAAAVVRRSRPVVRPGELAVLATIGALIVTADGLYALASTIGLLGVVAVLGALHPVVTMGLARACLHERITRTQQLGVAVCICGVLAISAT